MRTGGVQKTFTDYFPQQIVDGLNFKKIYFSAVIYDIEGENLKLGQKGFGRVEGFSLRDGSGEERSYYGNRKI